MKTSGKRILLYIAIIACFCFISFFAYEAFLRPVWADFTEKRVQQNIVENFYDRQSSFQELLDYLQEIEIKPATYFEIGKDKSIWIDVYGPSINDPSIPNVPLADLSNENGIHEDLFVEIMEDGSAKLILTDTMIILANWHFHFDGNESDDYFQELIDIADISRQEFIHLKSLLEKVGCESLELSRDGSISLRYDGNGFCQYLYYIPADISRQDFLEYKQDLGDGIYCGLNRSDLFCGTMIFDKWK